MDALTPTGTNREGTEQEKDHVNCGGSRNGSGNNQPALNKKLMEQIPIPLPPLEKQMQIVQQLDERLSTIDAAAVQIEKGAARASRLILKRAFEGKLVPQGPTDEPASDFLSTALTSSFGLPILSLATTRNLNAPRDPPRGGRRRCGG